MRGADFLERANHGVVDRSNVDITVDDGRNHLLVTEERYDVITADVIQPVHAGAGKVWSIEYWELARDALADGGLMLQWVPDERDVHYEMIVRSFLEVFPYATAWANGSMLVGTREPLRIDPRAVRRAACRSGDPRRDGVRRHRRRDVAGGALHRGSRRAAGIRRSRSRARRRPSAGRVLPHARHRRRAAPRSRAASTATQGMCSIEPASGVTRPRPRCVCSFWTAVRTAVANGLQRNQPPNALVSLDGPNSWIFPSAMASVRVVIPEKTRIIETGSVETTRSTSRPGSLTHTDGSPWSSTSHSVVASSPV